MTARLRSALFVPATQERRIEKALAAGADAVIVDLEDAVARSEKVAAREAARRGAERPRDCRFYVRVNALPTPLALRDLEAMALAGVDGIVLPMAESGADVRTAAWVLEQCEAERGLEVGRIELLPIIETAVGLTNVREVLAASPRVARAAFGAGDWCADTGMPWEASNPALAAARFELAVASRACDRDRPIDTAFVEVRDPEAFAAEAALARRLGFGGKFCIHPTQVEPANHAFSPSTEEVAWARRVWDAFLASESNGVAALVIDGKFVDYPVARQARETLERAGEAPAGLEEVAR